jgi:glycosyltransferase involved in cell wall biosynthesis
MRIGIEAQRANCENPTGVEHYAKNLILALAKIDQENEYTLYLQTAPAAWFSSLPSNFKTKVIPFPIFWTQLRISWEMITHPVDVLFIMASALPLIHPKNSYVTIHDIAWDFYPETFSTFMLNYLKFSTWFAVKFARNVISVSEATKKDLVRKYNLPEQKIKAIHLGFDMATEQMHSDEVEIKKIALLPEKFIVSLSTLQPRKNIIGLIDAFVELKKEQQLPHSLVLVGGKGWLYEEIMEKIKDHPEVIYFGYAQDRFAILKKADLLVQPAFYEGFGLQLLDAFASGVPVACSNVSSLPEVAGEAAIYFDPKNQQDIKRAIAAALNDMSLRQRLIEKGSERIKDFTWEKCAQETRQLLIQK